MRAYQELLMTELSHRKKRNAQFSLRAFARVLDVSPSHLSSLIGGKKNLTRKLAMKIVDKLDLTVRQRKEMMHSCLDLREPVRTETEKQVLLKEDEFELISRWYYFAILSLGRLPDNRANGKWIGDRLGISFTEATEALNRLLRLNLIAIKEGRFSQIGESLTTTTDVPSSAIRRHHKDNLDLAREKIDTVPLEKRSFTSITMAVNPQKLKKVKKMMDEFKMQVCDELEQGTVREVYTLSLQLFPVTQGGK